MASLPVILDISSDEDEPEGEDYDWLSEVLNSVERPPPEDDSDDVVVISEVNHRKRAKLFQPVEKHFDDDCVILEGDPEKSDGVVNEPETESDELLIVGEKGQVACRDFPHSRQHCAKFPFSSTPPERHCILCHCYVCDSIAPCKYWGKGSSIYDHCHATEKEEMWKLQRENRKQRQRALSSAPKLPYTSHSMSHPQLNHVPRHNNVQPSTVIRSTPNPVIPEFGTPRVRNQTKGYMAQQCLLARNKRRHHLASQQLVRPRSNDFIRKERDHGIGNPGARYDPSQRTHQRSPSVGGAILGKQSGHGSSYSINHVQPLQQSKSRSHPSTSKGNMFQVQSQPFSQAVNGSQQHDDFPVQPESSSRVHARSDQSLPDFDFENWLLDNDTLQDGLGAPTDAAGMPDFDFELWLMGNE